MKTKTNLSNRTNDVPRGGITTSRRLLGRRLLGVLAAAAAPLTQAQLLVNGSFEAPAKPADGLYGWVVPTGWSGIPPYLFRGNNGSSWPLPEDGQQFMDLGWGNGTFTLWQSVSISTPGEYSLQWYDNTAVVYGANHANYRAQILDATSAVVAQDLFDSGHFGVWGARTLTANLASGSYTVKFSSGPFTGVDTLLDHVSVTAVVPEPATWGSVAALGCLLWRVCTRVLPAERGAPTTP